MVGGKEEDVHHPTGSMYLGALHRIIKISSDIKSFSL